MARPNRGAATEARGAGGGIDLDDREDGVLIDWIVSLLALIGKRVRKLWLVHLMYQRLNFIGPHWRTHEQSQPDSPDQQYSSKLFFNRHGFSSSPGM